MFTVPTTEVLEDAVPAVPEGQDENEEDTVMNKASGKDVKTPPIAKARQ